MASETLLARISDYANRPNPYPLYAELREAGPVVRQADGSCLIGTYHEIAALLHDPRMSAEPRRTDASSEETRRPPFLRIDDPEHHRLRTLTMRPFGPPHTPGRVDAMRGEIARITGELIEALRDREQFDVVDDFAYPLPITVICRLMGVPREDEALFQGWTDVIVASADIGPEEDTTERDKAGLQARQEMGGYLVNLAEQRRGSPTGDMLSDLINEPDPALRLTVEELAETTILLFIAGHETTVNLITNGVLTLLRRPDELDRLRREPDLLPRAVEELLRYEPPVHMRERIPLADIDVAGTTIPRARPSSWRWPRAAATPSGSTSPTCSTPPARTTSTSASAAGSISAMAHHSPASKPRPRSARCFPTSARPAWSRTRPPTARTPCSAAPATCPSNCEPARRRLCGEMVVPCGASGHVVHVLALQPEPGGPGEQAAGAVVAGAGPARGVAAGRDVRAQGGDAGEGEVFASVLGDREAGDAVASSRPKGDGVSRRAACAVRTPCAPTG